MKHVITPKNYHLQKAIIHFPTIRVYTISKITMSLSLYCLMDYLASHNKEQQLAELKRRNQCHRLQLVGAHHSQNRRAVDTIGIGVLLVETTNSSETCRSCLCHKMGHLA